jgi:hypothetical protein
MVIAKLQSLVYVVLGIDAHEHDQVLAVCRTYEEAKRYCIECLAETEFYDLWIEKHPVV